MSHKRTARCKHYNSGKSSPSRGDQSGTGQESAGTGHVDLQTQQREDFQDRKPDFTVFVIVTRLLLCVPGMTLRLFKETSAMPPQPLLWMFAAMRQTRCRKPAQSEWKPMSRVF